MIEFLTFETFLTPIFLIILYYVGAIVIPLLSYVMAKWIKHSYFDDISCELKKYLSIKQRAVIILIALLCFICMEIFWRMMFEFFIAYFDMHDALIKLTQ